MNRITRDEFIEWIRQNFPNNVEIGFKNTYKMSHLGKVVLGFDTIYLDNSGFNTINFTDEP